MNLWEKESNSDLFIDLFADKTKIKGYNEWNGQLKNGDFKNSFLGRSINPGKNNEMSENYSAEGVNLMSNGDLGHRQKEMNLFNLSLCFAELGTKNESLACENRASCFFELEMYDEALADIELVKGEHYPNVEELMARKEKFQKAKNSTKEATEFQPKLSFEANERFPCMANVLDVQQNDEFGRHIVATQDIDVGQTILVEESFVSVTACKDQMQCDTCLQTMKNFIACPNCTDMMFCDERCQRENDIHREFCGENIHRMPSTVKFIAKSILFAVISFPDVEYLMRLVKDVLAKGDTQKPPAADAATNDLKSKYEWFLNLEPRKQENLDLDIIYKVFTAVMDIQAVEEMFNSLQSERFLMHLIGKHFPIISNNSFSHSEAGSITLLTASFLNHACKKNVFHFSNGRFTSFITLYPIKNGEQLYIDYLPGIKNERREKLKLWGFKCKCGICDPQCSMDDHTIETLSQYYERITDRLKGGSDFFHTFGCCDYKTYKTECEDFLRRFGHLPWSQDLETIVEFYGICLANSKS